MVLLLSVSVALEAVCRVVALSYASMNFSYLVVSNDAVDEIAMFKSNFDVVVCPVLVELLVCYTVFLF